MMHRIFPLVLAGAILSGCGVVERLRGPVPEAAAPAAAAPAMTIPALGQGQSAAVLDASSAAQRAAAVAAPQASDRALGKVVVALGSPAEQGFWLKSNLVAVAGKGRVVTASGAMVAVDLQPNAGTALLSLGAYRALGLSLTDLPEVSVFAQ